MVTKARKAHDWFPNEGTMQGRPKATKAALERAARLRTIRERLHKIMSQRAFAARLGVSQARYNHWERGWPIPLDQIRKIKDITPGITGDYIVWGDREGLTMEIIRLLLEDSPPPPKKRS